MRGKAMMNSGIAALSAKSFAGALLTGILRIGSSRDGQINLANGFPAGMSAIRNRYLNEIFVRSGSSATVVKMRNGNDY